MLGRPSASCLRVLHLLENTCTGLRTCLSIRSRRSIVTSVELAESASYLLWPSLRGRYGLAMKLSSSVLSIAATCALPCIQGRFPSLALCLAPACRARCSKSAPWSRALLQLHMPGRPSAGCLHVLHIHLEACTGLKTGLGSCPSMRHISQAHLEQVLSLLAFVVRRACPPRIVHCGCMRGTVSISDSWLSLYALCWPPFISSASLLIPRGCARPMLASG